jgi:hypothetical protein
MSSAVIIYLSRHAVAASVRAAQRRSARELAAVVGRATQDFLGAHWKQRRGRWGSKMCAGVLVCTLLALQVSVVGGALCNATCAAQSAVYAEGLSLATAGEAVRFLILARDSRGAPTGRGGEAWDIRATHALGPSLPVALEVHANGTYSAAATATVAGRYVLRVRLRPLLVDVGGT